MEKEQRNGLKHSSEKEIVNKEKISLLKNFFLLEQRKDSCILNVILVNRVLYFIIPFYFVFPPIIQDVKLSLK